MAFLSGNGGCSSTCFSTFSPVSIISSDFPSVCVCGYKSLETWRIFTDVCTCAFTWEVAGKDGGLFAFLVRGNRGRVDDLHQPFVLNAR